jgi:hypothetical protein
MESVGLLMETEREFQRGMSSVVAVLVANHGAIVSAEMR